MKPLGFLSYSVTNHKRQRKNFNTGKCETYSSQHSLWVTLGHTHLQLRSPTTMQWPWLFRNNIQFCAGEETKQLGDFTTSAPGGAQSEEGCTAGKQLGHGQMGGCEVGQVPGAHVRAHHLRPRKGSFRKCLREKFLPWHGRPTSGPQCIDPTYLTKFSYYSLAKFDFFRNQFQWVNFF